jgi:hypothetical protein
LNGIATGEWHGELDAFARYDVDGAQWFVRVPVRRDHAFTITGLPAGKSTLGLRAMVGDGERTVLGGSAAASKIAELAWPSGPPIEIVARGPLSSYATAWIVPLQSAPFGSADAIASYAVNAPTSASCALHPIGAGATPGGRSTYQVGDRHCVLADNPNTKLTVCVAGDGSSGDGARIVCAPVEVTAPPRDTPTEPAVVLMDTSSTFGAPPK